MVRFRGIGKACAVPAALMFIATGCATGGGAAAPAGQSRSPRPSPVPSATGYVKRADFLTGLTCLPAGSCVAVGWYYYGTAGPEQTLALRWNGRAWLAGPSPGGGPEDPLESVSCSTASSCLAVGALAEVLTGTGWSVIPGPPGGAMSSVSCPAPGSCQAVGWLLAGSRPVAAHWNGRAWLAERVPRPKPAPQTLTLAAVSCPAPSFCMAVGDDSHGAKAMPSPSYRDLTLVERWNGSRWRIIPAPSPTHASRLTGVSCPAPATACTTVGTTHDQTMAERWNGSTWTVQRTPNPT